MSSRYRRYHGSQGEDTNSDLSPSEHACFNSIKFGRLETEKHTVWFEVMLKKMTYLYTIVFKSNWYKMESARA